MSASDSLSFEPGIITVSCMATLALRIRVSMSAIGSTMVIVAVLLSPARLGHARDLAVVHHLPKTDPAQPELAEHGLGPAAPAAPGVGPDLELGLALLLLDECLLGHDVRYCPSRLNGKPKAVSRARPSGSVRAVVTMVMSIPLVVSM